MNIVQQFLEVHEMSIINGGSHGWNLTDDMEGDVLHHVIQQREVCLCVKEVCKRSYKYSIVDDAKKVVNIGVVKCDSSIEASVKILNIALRIFKCNLCIYTFSKYLCDLVKELHGNSVHRDRGRRVELNVAIDELKSNMLRVVSCTWVNRHDASSKCKIAIDCVNNNYNGENVRENDWMILK
jgi:hypothetical protein